MTPERKPQKTLRLGELLLAHQIVTPGQLENARKLQGQQGNKLGSALVDLGYLNVDDLVKALEMQSGVEGVNLFKVDIPPAVLRLLPLEKMKKHHVLPLTAVDRKVSMAMINPSDIKTLQEIQFVLGQSIRPLIAPAFQMEAAFRLLERPDERSGQALAGAEIALSCKKKVQSSSFPDITHLCGELVTRKASDLLLVAGVPPSLKLNGEVVRLAMPVLTPEAVNDYARRMMTDVQWELYQQTKEADFSLSMAEWGRFRINAYRQRKTVSLSIRHIVEDIPSLAALGLPPSFEELALKTQGLILLTGPNGHGKTTTMSALLDIVNRRQKKNIITIEDPIEYLHTHKSSNVNQREVGVDTDSFHEGLRRIFREAPDIIVIGEMRDAESFSIALQAADSGHLVLSCMHANNALLTVNRIIDVFPPEQQHQVRVQLADTFVSIVNQRLIPRKDGNGRVLAYEKLDNSQRIKKMIKDGKEDQIRSLMQQSMEEFWSLDVSLAQLCREQKITLEAALQYSQDSMFFRDLVHRGIGAARSLLK